MLSALSAAKRNVDVVGSPQNYFRILAVLHLMKRPSKIHLFLRSGICDDDLPLQKEVGQSDDPNSLRLRSRHNSKAPFLEFKKSEDTERFWKQQWSVIAHEFTGPVNRFYPKLEAEKILPFMEYHEMEREGGEGIIYYTRIHPDYHPWHRDEPEVRFLTLASITPF